jgi:Putative Actinobacterial Holin-X, holin superfamily III
MTNVDPEQKAATASLGDILGDLSRDISNLFRQEVDLAKAELTQSAKKAGKGAGFLGGAGAAGYLALLFLSLTIMFALAVLFDHKVNAAFIWASLIVTVIWGIVAAILAARGRRELDAVQGAPQTVDSVKKIPQALK